jgi:GEVED domain
MDMMNTTRLNWNWLRTLAMFLIATPFCFLQAQTVSIDGGSTSGNGPMGTLAHHAGEYLYLSTEIAQDFTITRINFKNAIMAGSGAFDTFNNVNLYLRYTAATSLATGTYPGTGGYTLVYSGPIVWSKSGWSGADLQTPFAYAQASGNLQLLVVRADAALHTGTTFYAAVTAATTCRRFNGAAAPIVGTSTLTASTFRAAVQFLGQPICGAAPNPGNTLFVLGSGCSGTSFSMSLQNPPNSPDVTYQWQSADDAAFTVNVVSMGTNANQWASQTTDKFYRCLVTCPANPPAVASNPLFVPTLPGHQCALCAAGANAADHFFFEKISNVAFGSGSTVNNTSADAIGPYQNFRGLRGDVLVNNSFDVTVTVSGAAATDQIQIWCDWDQNGGFANDPTELMHTSALGTGPFTATILVPPGATLGSTSMRIRLHDNSFGPLFNPCGNSSYGEVEDYTLNVLPEPTCGLPSGLAASLASATTANVSWLAAPSAVSYDVEVRQGGAPGSGGATFTGSTGALTLLATGLTFGQSYDVYVRADCGGGDVSAWVGPVSHLQDYCAADAPFNPLNNPTITQFTYAGINNANANTAGYLNFTAQMAFVEAGVATPFSIARFTDFGLDSLFIWVDLNNDIDFNDPGELVYTSPALFPDPLNDFITIPNGTTPGPKRMRVRRVNMTPGFGYTSPCGTAPFGQTHDYTVDVCGPVVATASAVDDCVNNEFSVAVNISSNPGGAMTISWVATPGGPGSMAGALGLNNLPDFPAGTQVDVSVTNGTVCELDLGSYFSNCPVLVTCGTPLTVSHCYRNNDPRTFTFISSDPSQTIRVTFISGTMATNDLIRGFSAADQTLPIDGNPLEEGNLTGNFPSLAGTTGTSSGDTLYMEIDSDGSGSCQDGDPSASTWTFEVECTPSCVDPDAAISVNTNCAAYNYTIDVEVTDTGDGATTDLEYTLNPPAAPTVITGLVISDIETLGPFAIDDVVSIRLLHEDDSNCNRNFGNFTDDNSCIAGEACISAVVLGVNPLGGCPAGGTAGTNTTATQDGGLFSCSASTGPFLDKWYRFNSGANTSVGYTFSSFTFTSLLVEVFEGACNGTSVHCALGGSALSNAFATTPNTDYWIRMASVAGQGGNFTICLFAAPPPPDPCATIANIASCDVSTGPVTAPAGTGAWSNNTLGGPYQTPGIERIFTYTATVTGLHTINVTQYTGGNFADIYWKLVGTCNNSGWNYHTDFNAAIPLVADGLNGGVGLNFVAGNTYYIMWDLENTATRTIAFQVVCPIPAPANDDCADAISLTPSATCVPVAGTSIGATQSVAPSTCTGFLSTAANDVWYSFTATRTSHRITVAGQGAFDGVVELRSGACNGTSVSCVDATVNGGTEVLTVPGLTVGQTYLVRVYGWAGGTGTFTICVEEPDCAGVFGGAALPGTACDDANANTVLDVYDANCVCAGSTCTTNLQVEFQLDGGSTVTWELRQQGSDILVQTGVAFLPLPGTLSQSTCLPDGCYYLRVLDDSNDGITTGGTQGGYILRTTAPDRRLIDNRKNFLTGSVSQIAGNQGFCLPLGNDRLISASCDRLDLQRGANAQCSEKLTADNTPNGTSGNNYQFWIYNPNGPESQFIPATGAMGNILSMNQVTLPAGKLYNIRVRTRISAGVWREWGPACRMSISSVPLPCRLTMLVDDLSNPNWSCGKTVQLPANGQGNGTANIVVAKPVQRLNANCSMANANKYQFRFTEADDPGNVIVVNGVGTNAFCYMTTALGFEACDEYYVDVRASFNNGGAWCAYSDVCSVYTGNCPGGLQSGVATAGTIGGLRMHPNPNNGQQLFIGMEDVDAAVTTASVDIHDAFGKRVLARTVAVNDGVMSTVLELQGSLASGLYVVNITLGEKVLTERLVIHP